MRPGGLFFSFTATSEYDLKQNPHFGTLRRMTKDLTELFYEGFAALEIYHSVHTTQQQKKVPWWIVLARKAMVNADG